jgi:hypothetical protein
MRYQERTYIQNNNGAVRNKDIFNVSMSSDMCIFNEPLFNVIGASKIDCTGSTTPSSYIISASTETIPLTFEFTANTESFIDNSVDFKFEIYKYDDKVTGFSTTAVYKSDAISYSAFSGTHETIQSISASALDLDGEFLIKGYYKFPACTKYLNELTKTVDTSNYISGSEYGIYNKNLDFHFIAINNAEIPNFNSDPSNNQQPNALSQNIILVSDNLEDNANTLLDKKTVIVPSEVSGEFIFTLNGLTLARDLDFTVSGSVITLEGDTEPGDIITITYTTTSNTNNLVGDTINVSSKIVSGATDNQSTNIIYFNTDTNKYEIYTSVTPLDFNSLIVMVNGITIASGIDYYQSVSNKKRIILEGEILIGDIITIVYYPVISVVNGLNTNTPNITWSITTPPQKENGLFTLEVGLDKDFNDIYYSGSTPYLVDSISYSQSFVASGSVGTQLFYRVKNEKNFETFCGDIITTTAYSETIPIIIQTNAINSY